MIAVSRRKRLNAGAPSSVDREGPDARPHATEVEVTPRKTRREKAPPTIEKPGAGKSSKLGRKVESPASIRTAGPSGQRGSTQHQKLHTNK